ncbi:MAG: hypothetical protein Q8N05_13810 [Bacteroidota bacterium]|nr:hypothetical protein [Bacteroidota bacterium]
MTTRNILIVFIAAIALLSCDGMFDYSPYLIDFSEENRNVNQQNIGKLANQTKDDTITILLAILIVGLMKQKSL